MIPPPKKKILFILHLPPPIHGVSVMNQVIYDSALINGSFDCDFINLATAGKIENLQKHAFSKYFPALKMISRVLFKLLTRRYDEVYVTPFPYGFAFIKDSVTLLLIRLFGVKPILHLHTYGFKKAAGRSGLRKKYYRFVFKNVDVICLSKLLIEDIEGLYKGAVSILPNGIRQVNFENTYQLHNGPVQLLFLSNLIKGKGILLLIDAAAILKEQGYAFHLRVAGPESEITYNDLRALISAKQITDVITLAGPKYDVEKYEEFRKADIFILPSDYETFGLVLLEAMQFGVPCIAGNVGGIPDVLGDGRGILLNELNAATLAGAIAYLIDHPQERQSMGAAGFNYYKTHFTQDKFESGLNNILSRHTETLNTARL